MALANKDRGRGRGRGKGRDVEALVAAVHATANSAEVEVADAATRGRREGAEEEVESAAVQQHLFSQKTVPRVFRHFGHEHGHQFLVNRVAKLGDVIRSVCPTLPLAHDLHTPCAYLFGDAHF